MKYCFHPTHGTLITLLFPRESKEAEKRQAVALHHIGGLLRIGTPFCQALRQTTYEMNRYIENKILFSDESPLWRETLIQFENLRNEALSHCNAFEISMPQEEREKYSGVVSDMVRCIVRIQSETAMKLVASQYAEEERGFKDHM